jgi:hypothetical protein
MSTVGLFDEFLPRRMRSRSSPPLLGVASRSRSYRSSTTTAGEDLSDDEKYVCPPTPEPEIYYPTKENHDRFRWFSASQQCDPPDSSWMPPPTYERGAPKQPHSSSIDLTACRSRPQMHRAHLARCSSSLTPKISRGLCPSSRREQPVPVADHTKPPGVTTTALKESDSGSSTHDSSVDGTAELSDLRSCDSVGKEACLCSRPCRFGKKCFREDCAFCHLHHSKPTSFSIAVRNRKQQSNKMRTDPLHDLINETLRWWDRSVFKQRKQALRVRAMCFVRLESLRYSEQAQKDDGSTAAVQELSLLLEAIRKEHERDREAVPSSLGKLYLLCSCAT